MRLLILSELRSLCDRVKADISAWGFKGEVRARLNRPNQQDFNMGKCRKCEGKTTRRRAGQFYCRHCGMQPGAAGYDRGGIPRSEREDQNSNSCRANVPTQQMRREGGCIPQDAAAR